MGLPSDLLAPFHLEGSGPSCLLLHGFTGTPAELRYLASRLADAGFDVTAPALPGQRSGRLGAQDWLAAAREALDPCLARGPTCVGGLSMGALLAVALAVEWPEQISCLTLLAPAVRLQQPAQAVAQLFRRLPQLQLAVPLLPKFGGSDLRDRAAKAWNPTGDRVPTHGLAELAALGERACALAPQVVQPALVLLGDRDGTIDNRAARRFAATLGGPYQLRTLAHSGHQVALDFDRAEVAGAVIGFLQKQLTERSV